MLSDTDNLLIIEERGKLFEDAKEETLRRINHSIEKVMNKLKEVEEDLLSEAEAAFGDNPFLEIAGRINSENKPDAAEISKILAMKLPQNFGPNEDSLNSLLREIDKFKRWKNDEDKEEPGNPALTPKNLRCIDSTCDTLTIYWDSIKRDCIYEIEANTFYENKTYRSLENEYKLTDLKKGKEYAIRVRAVLVRGNDYSPWCTSIIANTDYPYSWKKCPTGTGYEKAYSLDEDDPTIVTKCFGYGSTCTIVGSTSFPPRQVTTWNIKILNTRDGNGCGIFVGIAPKDVYQYSGHRNGWFFHCFTSTLKSGPPHNYSGVQYGPRIKKGEYVGTDTVIGAVIDMTRGVLSFSLDGEGLGEAYEGIPLDEPLVPCVILTFAGDSVKLGYVRKKRRRR